MSSEKQMSEKEWLPHHDEAIRADERAKVLTEIEGKLPKDEPKHIPLNDVGGCDSQYGCGCPVGMLREIRSILEEMRKV